MAELWSGALVGFDAVPVRVEVDLLHRLPVVQIVGLAASAVREAAERVRSAIQATGLEWPRQRVVVNLAPADLRKDGTAFDLPIALGVLATAGHLGSAPLTNGVFSGELSLSGELRPIRGGLSFALMAREHGFREVILPQACASEAAVVEGVEVFGADRLSDVIEHLSGRRRLVRAEPASPETRSFTLDLADIRGFEHGRRALEIAAAGGHNLLLVGPPGCGKTMLASRLSTILPEMTIEEAIEATRIHSVAGLRNPGAGLMLDRPFRAPHHSISAAGMVGSAILRPGEVSLAHNGVLFLDELPEFQRHVLELLRDPLETRRVSVCRALGSVVFPASFALVVATNPCPCGFRGHPRRPCGCSDEAVRRYHERVSGALLDRIDLHVSIAPVPVDDLVADSSPESSATVRARVVAARRRQVERLGPGITNGSLSGEQVREAIDLAPEARRVLQTAVGLYSMSGKACSRLLKVARTIADMEGTTRVEGVHITEALRYRGWDASEPSPAQKE